MAQVDVIYYLDVLSSWCFVAESALERIEEKYGDRVRLDWRIAQLFDYGPLPYTAAQLAWYYGRSAAISGTQLNAAWHDSPEDTTVYANQAAQAARSLGLENSNLRREISRAALLEGKPLGRRDRVIEEAARLSGLGASELDAAMEDNRVKKQIAQSTREFKDLALPQLPAFVMRNAIGDLAVLSGLYTFESLDAAIAEMLHASSVTEDFGRMPREV